MKISNFFKLSIITLACNFAFTAYALPVLDHVGAGAININSNAASTVINQGTKRGIINWQTFNVNKNESVRFNQPAGGITLNRVNGVNGISNIYGQISANGTIILVNPAGIYFGPTSVVNVGGIIATTSSITDRDFLAGNYRFIPSNTSGSIVNAGTIIAADHGLVALVGSSVSNEGLIQANMGHAILAAADKFSINFAGNDAISFVVDRKAKNLGLNNTGRIIANGGQVFITASAASNVLDNTINMRGYVEAQSVEKVGGSVILSAPGSTVRVAANIKANDVSINGTNVLVDSDTQITANTIRIGRDASGSISDRTLIMPNVNLTASQLLETSGKFFALGDNVNIKTPTWLLDPTDLTISNAPSTGVTNFLTNNNLTASNLNVNTLLNQLALSNVILQTTGGGSGAGSGNIIVASNINWGSAYSLTLTAYNNILINSGISISNSNAGAGLNLIANNSGAFAVGSGNGTVVNNGSLNMAGNINVYYNPTAYTSPTSYTNLGSGALNAYMLLNSDSNLQTLSSNSNLWNQNFALSKSIDLNSLSLSPIGNSTTAFSGRFDGQGHVLSNLSISATNNVGLFGVTDAQAVIANLGVTGNVNGINNVGLVVGDNAGTLSSIFAQGFVTGSGIAIGGIAGHNSGALSDIQSQVAVAGGDTVGGIIGDNSGTLINALAIGAVTGTTAGGLVGVNSGSVTQSYWDTETTGQSVAADTNTGTLSATGGCFGSSCTTDLTQNTSYDNWDFANTWGIIAGQSYPYLQSIFGNAPRAISGQIGEFTSNIDNPNWAAMAEHLKNPDYTSFAALLLAQQQLSLAANGSVLDSQIFSGANGRYYTLLTTDTLADNTPLLAYLTNSSNKANTVTLAPTGNSSLTNLNLALNTVMVTDNGQLTRLLTDLNYSDGGNILGNPPSYMPIAQSDVVAALGSLSDPGLLYSTSGNNINVDSNNNFLITPTTWYQLNGNITTDQGSITAGGTLGIEELPSSYNQLVTLQTINGGNIYVNNMLWKTYPDHDYKTDISILSSNNIILQGILTDYRNVDMIQSGTNYEVQYFRGLNLSAAFTPQSITTGDITQSYIVLGFLNIMQGRWYQNFPPQTSLYYPGTDYESYAYYPLLNADHFTLGNGNFPNNQVEFARFGGGDGTIDNPYIIYDVFGLQGIATSDTLLNAHYQLGGDNPFQYDSNVGTVTYDPSVNNTHLWNDGQGFIPIGTLAHPFNGTFDGNNQDFLSQGIWGLEINRPNENNIGIFGVTGTQAVISNLMMFENLLVGHNNVGGLVGINNGLIDNVEVTQSFVIGNQSVGTIAGINNGTISNSGVYSNRTAGISQVGGLAGVNTGLIDQSYAANFVIGKTQAGGLAGVNSGTILNSFWDTGATGQKLAANGGTLDHVYGGCLTGGNCAFGGTVNLSNPDTYLSAADGGLGLVTNSWDFNGTWEMSDGYSYPYHSVIYDPAGGPAIVYSGKSNIPNQILFMIWGLGDELQGGSAFYGNTVTGADGSFYIVWSYGSVLPGNFVLFDFIGGNAQGSVGFVAQGDPLGFDTPNVRRVPLVGSYTNAPANSLGFYSQVELLALFAGIPLDQLYTANFVNTGSDVQVEANQVYKSINAIYDRNSIIAAIYNYNYTLYQQHLYEAYEGKYGNNSLLIAIKAFELALDSALINQTDIKQILPCN